MTMKINWIASVCVMGILGLGTGVFGQENIYEKNGFFGMGTNNPVSKLHIRTPNSAMIETLLKLDHRASAGEAGARIELGSGYTEGAVARITGMSSPHHHNFSWLVFETSGAKKGDWNKMILDNHGQLVGLNKLGVGTVSPAFPIHAYVPDSNGTVTVMKLVHRSEKSWGGAQIELGSSYSEGAVARIAGEAEPWRSNRSKLVFQTAAYKKGEWHTMTFDWDGHLSVPGSVIASDFKLRTTQWADDVFEPGYSLMSLSDLNAFVTHHKHLPHFPSEKTIQEKGASVADTQVQLLRTVEELTLHVIALDKRVKALEAEKKRFQKQTF